MVLKNLGNYKIFLLSNSVLAFAIGLFVPFWIIFIQKIGGSIEQFGFALGLMVLSQAIVSYFAGKYSDKLGRKPLLIATGFLYTGIVFAYTLINSLIQLYFLQIINGFGEAMLLTLGTAFLGDVTKKSSRGADIGKYHAVTGALVGIAMMAGGVLVGQLGLKILFYIISAIIFFATVILFFIEE